jgi:nicotinamidase-related amidase
MMQALVVIDLQEAMRDWRDAGHPWANPDAVQAAGRMVAAFRTAGLPVVHVHHHATNPDDEFHPTNPLSAAMPEVAPIAGEVVVIKHGSSGFIGTDLEGVLRRAGLTSLVVVGGEANMCVESTTRMAGNLGFEVTVVADALVNFGRNGRQGAITTEQVLDMTLSNLTAFARIADTAAVIAEIEA